ncbi:TPA: hypothetical protein HA251_02095 [Candidatus Woesearchaeota archaeon]|nr:hypothetical protein [Candidatus Woesearchaeota archaeon]
MPRIKKLDNKDYKTVIDACRKDLSDRLGESVKLLPRPTIYAIDASGPGKPMREVVEIVTIYNGVRYSYRLENNVPMYSGACKQGIELIAALKRKLDI